MPVIPYFIILLIWFGLVLLSEAFFKEEQSLWVIIPRGLSTCSPKHVEAHFSLPAARNLHARMLEEHPMMHD